MYSKKEFSSQAELFAYLKAHSYVYFFGEFLREINAETDELMIIIRKDRLIDLDNVPLVLNVKSKRIILSTKVERWEKLLNFWEIIYGAYSYQNEIYDFYGKETTWFKNHILRLHFFPKDFFPYRKIWQSDIESKTQFEFPEIEWDGLICVPVGPIHAGVISPGHFRFLVDGEDTLDLEIQLGWKIRLVDKYFMEETNIPKLLEASQDIVWDSVVAYSLWFVRNIENASLEKISLLSQSTRIVMLEIERIYNHLSTIGGLLNDVWQSYILNGFLAIREEILHMNEHIFENRLLKWNIEIWGNRIELDFEKIQYINDTLRRLLPRIENLINITKFSSWIYDRFKDTGIVTKETALKHNALWIIAKASMISIDWRTTDEYYINLWLSDLSITIGETWDSFDRLMVRAEEIFQSIGIITAIFARFETKSIVHRKSKKIKDWADKIQLNDGYFITHIEWHRGENLQIMIVENKRITYYKHRDPSFVNWALLEYAVLKNIIADFPICNKSFDLSYSWYDM